MDWINRNHFVTEPAVAPLVASLPHAVFLRRVATRPATDPEVRLGQGAFLVLRLVDLLSPDREPVASDAFRYQWTATERYCTELEVEGPEGVHLSGLVQAIHDAHRLQEFKLLAPAFLAYALFLEEEGHYEEAADVLETLARTGGERLVASDRTANLLRLGRVQRKVALFDQAAATYHRAGESAQREGDGFSALLARIGYCNVLHFRGNLAEAERCLLGVLEDARRGGFRQAEAMAEHGLGSVLDVRGNIDDGVPHLWRAYELYEDDSSRLRVLHDIGMDFLSLGDADSAERAFRSVAARSAHRDEVLNALVELMHCASYRRDRLAFERRRQECDARVADMPPNVLTDYCLKSGIGAARFGNYTKARALMTEGLAIASRHGLHEFEFRIERILNGLGDCEAAAIAEEAASTPVHHSEAVREVSASLSALAV
jgi:tetratricopeptide (TPR) repeat protein